MDLTLNSDGSLTMVGDKSKSPGEMRFTRQKE
jgi:hypothetical protein